MGLLSRHEGHFISSSAFHRAVPAVPLGTDGTIGAIQAAQAASDAEGLHERTLAFTATPAYGCRLAHSLRPARSFAWLQVGMVSSRLLAWSTCARSSRPVCRLLFIVLLLLDVSPCAR